MLDYLCNVSDVLRSLPQHQIDDFADSFSKTQYTSKKWLVETLAKQELPQSPSILILGGWYGSFLVPMLQQQYPDCSILLTDQQSEPLSVAEYLHKARYMGTAKIRMGVVDVEKDIQRIQNQYFDVVINTSCEHMGNLHNIRVANPNALYVFQACDEKDDPGHINPIETTDVLLDQCQLDSVLYRGRLDLGHKNRFMVIGKKQQIP